MKGFTELAPEGGGGEGRRRVNEDGFRARKKMFFLYRMSLFLFDTQMYSRLLRLTLVDGQTGVKSFGQFKPSFFLQFLGSKTGKILNNFYHEKIFFGQNNCGCKFLK